MTRFACLRTSLLVVLLALPLSAHIVRLEPRGDELVLVFGEPGMDNETSPGRLDKLSPPFAWTPGEKRPSYFTVSVAADHFSLATAKPSQVVLSETRYPAFQRSARPAFQRGARPASWPQFYQRWHPGGASAAATPMLTLDIVPTGEPGRFRVYFRGLPLPGAKVGVDHFGNDAGGELVADALGYIHYTTDVPGLVLMSCNHKENLPGYTRGRAYEVTSHNTALTWTQP